MSFLALFFFDVKDVHKTHAVSGVVFSYGG